MIDRKPKSAHFRHGRRALSLGGGFDEAILLADLVVMMTNGPSARIGNIMEVDLPRPRSRQALLSHPKYYEYREELLTFLDEYETGAVSKRPVHPVAVEAARKIA